MICLDTSILIDILRGNREAISKIKNLENENYESALLSAKVENY